MFDVDVVGDDAGDPVGDEEDIAVGERGVDGVAELQVFQERLNNLNCQLLCTKLQFTFTKLPNCQVQIYHH